MMTNRIRRRPGITNGPIGCRAGTDADVAVVTGLVTIANVPTTIRAAEQPSAAGADTRPINMPAISGPPRNSDSSDTASRAYARSFSVVPSVSCRQFERIDGPNGGASNPVAPTSSSTAASDVPSVAMKTRPTAAPSARGGKTRRWLKRSTSRALYGIDNDANPNTATAAPAVAKEWVDC